MSETYPIMPEEEYQDWLDSLRPILSDAMDREDLETAHEILVDIPIGMSWEKWQEIKAQVNDHTNH